MSPILVGPLLLVETFHWLFAGTAVGFIVSAVMVSAIIFPFKGQVKVQYHFSKKCRMAVLVIKRRCNFLAYYVCILELQRQLQLFL